MTSARLPEILLLLLWPVLTQAQAKSALEQYSQVGDDNAYLWMPVLHYESSGGFYSEFRFNYEEKNTASLFAGKAFALEGKKIRADLVPLLGISTGWFRGISLGLNSDCSIGQFYMSSQMQYSHSWKSATAHFYFNWSEAGWNFSDRFYAGLACQFTQQGGRGDFQPGLVAGINSGSFSIPVYYFSAGKGNRLLMLGLIYEYNLQAKSKKGNKR